MYGTFGIQVISSGKLVYVTEPEGQESWGVTEDPKDAWKFYSKNSVNQWFEDHNISIYNRGSYLVTELK